MRHRILAVSAWVAAALAAMPVHAEHAKSVGDYVINIGVVHGRTLAEDPVERASHGTALLGSRQHVIVSLTDAATGRPTTARDVTVRVVDPTGRTEERRLVAGRVNDVPDYSELFTFGWSGPYRVQVRVMPEASPSAVVADFAWTHVVR